MVLKHIKNFNFVLVDEIDSGKAIFIAVSPEIL
jgi:hypothetical protein